MPTLSLTQAALCLVPAAIVVWIIKFWSLNAGEASYGLARMVFQLVLVGHALTFVVATEDNFLTLGVLVVMLLFAAWIALRPLTRRNPRQFIGVLLGMCVGAVFTVAFIFVVVLGIQPLQIPLLLIPLAGMTFAGAMNTTSLALERFENEVVQGTSIRQARAIAYRAALIPTINSLFAVGLVSMPGTMTGQIISGVPPHIAARYQILVMGMMFGASGIASACTLGWVGKYRSSAVNRRPENVTQIDGTIVLGRVSVKQEKKL